MNTESNRIQLTHRFLAESDGRGNKRIFKRIFKRSVAALAANAGIGQAQENQARDLLGVGVSSPGNGVLPPKTSELDSNVTNTFRASRDWTKSSVRVTFTL